MSPPYHVNLIQGLRFFQLAAILPLCLQGDQTSPPWSVPVLKKPGRKATQEQRLAYQAACKRRPASQKALLQLKTFRRELDEAGAYDKTLIAALDGSFCNAVFLSEKLERIELLCRCREDARLQGELLAYVWRSAFGVSAWRRSASVANTLTCERIEARSAAKNVA